jgi:hypothetical protein
VKLVNFVPDPSALAQVPVGRGLLDDALQLGGRDVLFLEAQDRLGRPVRGRGAGEEFAKDCQFSLIPIKRSKIALGVNYICVLDVRFRV